MEKGEGVQQQRQASITFNVRWPALVGLAGTWLPQLTLQQAPRYPRLLDHRCQQMLKTYNPVSNQNRF